MDAEVRHVPEVLSGRHGLDCRAFATRRAKAYNLKWHAAGTGGFSCCSVGLWAGLSFRSAGLFHGRLFLSEKDGPGLHALDVQFRLRFRIWNSDDLGHFDDDVGGRGDLQIHGCEDDFEFGCEFVHWLWVLWYCG